MKDIRSGYLIETSFERLYLEFDRPAEPGQVVYSIPQRGVPPSALSKRYRGIARKPLQAWDSELSEAPGVQPPNELEAAEEMRQLEDAGRSKDDFIFALADVERVLRKLRRPRDWEVVWVADSAASVALPHAGARLGFEPTWFTGDHFSALSDCMCFPEWHGTDEEGVLFASHYALLNEHALFQHVPEAEEFLTFYRSHDWTESGEYVIAEVRSVA